MGQGSRLKNKHGNGFSLLELLVTLGIIGILLSLLIVGFFYIQEKQRKRRAEVEITALKAGITSYAAEHGNYPNCPEKICSPGECLFLSMLGFHNAEGGLELPPYPTSLPIELFGFDLSKVDLGEIPPFSHDNGNALKLWLAQTLDKNPVLSTHGEMNINMNIPVWMIPEDIEFFPWDPMGKPVRSSKKMIFKSFYKKMKSLRRMRHPG